MSTNLPNIFRSKPKNFLLKNRKGSKNFLWTRRVQFWLPSRKIFSPNPLKFCSKYQTRETFIIFSEITVFVNTFLWTLERQFWKRCGNFFAHSAEVFRSQSKNDWNFLAKTWLFPENVFPGRQRAFWQPWRKFSLKTSNFSAHCPKRIKTSHYFLKKVFSPKNSPLENQTAVLRILPKNLHSTIEKVYECFSKSFLCQMVLKIVILSFDLVECPNSLFSKINWFTSSIRVSINKFSCNKDVPNQITAVLLCARVLTGRKCPNI